MISLVLFDLLELFILSDLPYIANLYINQTMPNIKAIQKFTVEANNNYCYCYYPGLLSNSANVWLKPFSIVPTRLSIISFTACFCIFRRSFLQQQKQNSTRNEKGNTFKRSSVSTLSGSVFLALWFLMCSSSLPSSSLWVVYCGRYAPNTLWLSLSWDFSFAVKFAGRICLLLCSWFWFSYSLSLSLSSTALSLSYISCLKHSKLS